MFEVRFQRLWLGIRELNFVGVVYIGGYMDNTTDIEMKRIVTQAGGQILYVPTKIYVMLVL